MSAKAREEIVGDWQSINCDVQGQLMEVTVLNPLSRMHPPSSQYRRMFLKYIISQLESVNVEVCVELYEEYTDMMSKSLAEDELCYKTYFLGNETRNVITMEESVKLVSRGTTGLQTWPAAQHLAEWTLENKHLFEGRCILELGSGLGFTGLVVCQNSHPKQYIFTDCHQDVLDTLTKNIALNVPTYAQSLRHAASIDSVQDKHQSPHHCCRDGTMCKRVQCITREVL
ncbi:hypothetical protein LSAT2_030062 [Lamellibrachia satsuma]|nr:hypothetical protein LSAT2_030062 [Lamellibrachia satsuma]